jgi:putative transposase
VHRGSEWGNGDFATFSCIISTVKFGFIAKHRGIWPAAWSCEALGVSRGGFHAWLTRPRSIRPRTDEDLLARIRSSFLGSDRTYGARRVWHDVLADGM